MFMTVARAGNETEEEKEEGRRERNGEEIQHCLASPNARFSSRPPGEGKPGEIRLKIWLENGEKFSNFTNHRKNGQPPRSLVRNRNVHV